MEFTQEDIIRALYSDVSNFDTTEAEEDTINEDIDIIRRSIFGGDDSNNDIETEISKSSSSTDIRENTFNFVPIYKNIETNYTQSVKREANNIILENRELDEGENVKIRTYKPKITRKNMSIFEYVGAITKLARFINNAKRLPDYTDDIEIYNVINPSEVAYRLLKSGAYDPIFDRGYEKVSFSQLGINPIWEKTIESYFESQHESLIRELSC